MLYDTNSYKGEGDLITYQTVLSESSFEDQFRARAFYRHCPVLHIKEGSGDREVFAALPDYWM